MFLVDKFALEQQEEKVHSLILLSLSDEVLYEVSEEKITYVLWLKLEKLFMTKSISNKLLLKQCLFMKEGMPHLVELNSALLELYDIDVKLEDIDLAMILLASPRPLSYESFVNFLSVGKDCITLEEVNSSLYSRELRHKASTNGDEASASRLSLTNFAKGQKKKKAKDSRREKLIQRISNYCKEPDHWKKDCPNKIKKDFVAVVVQSDKMIWYSQLLINNNIMLNNGYWTQVVLLI